jgi:hypothetical protein
MVDYNPIYDMYILLYDVHLAINLQQHYNFLIF